jgi:hypothetical protein
VWADDYNLTSVANSVESTLEVEEVDVTTFASGGNRQYHGQIP